MDFLGKTAVVTGAGSGIGQAIALSLADRLCQLALIDITEEKLQDTAAKLKEKGVQFSIHASDLGDREQAFAAAAAILKEHSAVDALFNIAGIAAGGAFEDVKVETIERIMQVNYFSQVYLMKAFLPHLKTRPQAHIVNMSSMTGLVAITEGSAYAASKFAVRGLSHVTALELADTNIQISIAYPGAVSTDIVKNSIPLYRYAINDKENDHSTITNGMSPAKAAEIIIKGAEKGKRDIIVGNDAKAIVALAKLFPKHYWSMVKRYVHI